MTVDGHRVNAAYELPAPASSFRGPGFRGVVALGSEPKVELFSHGLFVRSAQSLEELQDSGRSRSVEKAEGALAELPSLAPQVLLDSDEIELLLARSDARQDRRLAALTRRAEKELERLVGRKLQALRPQAWYRIWWGSLKERLERWFDSSSPRGLVLGIVLGLALGGGILGLGVLGELDRSTDLRISESLSALIPPTIWGSPDPAEGGASPWPGELPQGLGQPLGESALEGAGPFDQDLPVAGAASQPGARQVRPYRDLARRYRGPRVDDLGQDVRGDPLPALLYRPREQDLLFNALVVEDVFLSGPPQGQWAADSLTARLESLRPYQPTACSSDCVEVALVLSTEGVPLRLPIPTGHRLTSSTVRVDGELVDVLESPQGEAVLAFDDASERYLEYETGPARAPALPTPPLGRLPLELQQRAAEFRGLPASQQLAAAVDYVHRRIDYSRTQDTVTRFSRVQDQQGGFLETALLVGAGDCDVQNGVLTSLLREMGFEARMVLGYVGHAGGVAPGLHAWVEVRRPAAADEEPGSWTALDASFGPPAHPLAVSDGLALEDSAAVAGALPRGVLPLPALWMVLALLGVALGLVYLVRRPRISSGDLDLGEGGDLAALLGGALRHPEAFASMPALFHGRFIPLLGAEKALSLFQARSLSQARCLFRSDAGGDLARQAVAQGIPVIDGSTPEGRVTSQAFGAIDLDHWGELLDRCRESPTSERVDRGLESLGEGWRLRSAWGLPEAEMYANKVAVGKAPVVDIDIDLL